MNFGIAEQQITERTTQKVTSIQCTCVSNHSLLFALDQSNCGFLTQYGPRAGRPWTWSITFPYSYFIHS